MRGAERERVTSEDATKRHRVPEPDDSIQNNREGMELDKKKVRTRRTGLTRTFSRLQASEAKAFC